MSSELGTKLVRWAYRSARTFAADKPALRARLGAIWRAARTRGWIASGGQLQIARRVLDAAVPLRDQAPNWGAAADNSPPLPPTDLAAALAQCRCCAGLVVAVSHDDFVVVFGGVQNVIADEQRAFESAGWQHLHIAPAAPLPILAAFGPADEYRLQLRLNGKSLGVVTFPVLAAALAALRDSDTRLEIVFHHLKGHVPEHLATLPLTDGARPIVWAHDFFALCPNFNLMRNDVKFCGAPAPDSAACEVCIFGADRQDHLPRMHAFFAATNPIVLFPSQAPLDLWMRRAWHPYAEARVVPLAHLSMAKHDDPVTTPAGSPLRVAHLGSSIRQKGWHIFEALSFRYARDRRYKFYHLGVDGVPSFRHTYVPVRVTADQRNAMVDAVIRHRIDVVICWPLWPETFCFTVHEALAGGAFVLTHRAGGNVWPAIEANAPGQGCALTNEASLFRLFETGEVQQILARVPRFRGTLRPAINSAGVLLGERTRIVLPNDLQIINT